MTDTMTDTSAVSTIDQVSRGNEQQRRAAVVEYRELLLRSDRPAAGDAEALKRVMGILGRQASDLRGDADLVHALAEAEEAAGQVGECQARTKETREALQRIIGERPAARAAVEERFGAKLEAAGAARGRAQAELVTVDAKAREFRTACRRLAELGLADGLPEAPARKVTSTPVPTRAAIIESWRSRVARGYHPANNTPAALFAQIDYDLQAAGHPALTADEKTHPGEA